MTKLTYATAALMAFSISLTSCKKDDNATSASKSNTEKITAHDWILSKSVIDPKVDVGNGPTSDGLQLMEVCERDNIFIYETAGDYIGDEGADKCDEFSDQRSTLGTWKFNSDESQLIRNTKAFGEESADLISLSATELVIKGTQQVGNTLITYTNTYTKP